MDGAEGLQNRRKINFPGCQQIVNFHHTMGQLAQVLEPLTGKRPTKEDKKYKRWTKLLLKDGVRKRIVQAQECAAGLPCQGAVENIRRSVTVKLAGAPVLFIKRMELFSY